MTSSSSISKMTSTKIILMDLDEFEIEDESKPHSTAADPGWVSAVESQSRSLQAENTKTVARKNEMSCDRSENDDGTILEENG